MAAQDFARFVASQQNTTADDINADWDEVRNEWLDHLDDLHKKVIAFLQEFVANGSIRYSFKEITLNEEYLGSYRVKTMEISIGRQHVFLEPVSALLIGCWGRVDIVGSAGRAQLLLVNENAKSAADLLTVTVAEGTKKSVFPALSYPTKPPGSMFWKIAYRETRVRFAELDQEAFFALLMEVTGG